MQLSEDLCVFTQCYNKKSNAMKNRILISVIILLTVGILNPALAEEQERNVPSFSKIALHISGKVYLKQGREQSVRIVAKESTLEDIITEVKDKTLNIRFPNNHWFGNFDRGKIEIYITVPEVNGLSVSGSGDIASDEIKTGNLDLKVSGSGNIGIDELAAERVSSAISGSGRINIDSGDDGDELSVSISGSGNFNAEGYEADDVSVRISGSGNCKVKSNGSLKARISGSGNLYYNGNPSIDSSVSGSGKVRKM